MQRLLVRRPAQWSRHLLARSTLRSADASLPAASAAIIRAGPPRPDCRSPRPPCRSSRFGADGSAGICQSAMPRSLPLFSERRSVGSGQPRRPAWGIVCGVATPSARLPQSVRACRTLCSNCSMSAATCRPVRPGCSSVPEPPSCFAAEPAHGSRQRIADGREVGDGAAVTSGSGVHVATGLSQPAGRDDEALAGSSRGRAKGATTPVAEARSARFWSTMEGPPLMLAAPRPAGRDPGPAPPVLHKCLWLRQPPGRGWGDRARRNHRKRTAEGRRH